VSAETGTVWAVILFRSTTHVMRAEKALQKAGVPCRLIPVPRQLSSQCGVCLRVSTADATRAIGVLRDARVAYGGLHEVSRF
jgi:hypothetical protein